MSSSPSLENAVVEQLSIKTQFCNSCKTERSVDLFVGQNGKPVKACDRCRAKNRRKITDEIVDGKKQCSNCKCFRLLEDYVNSRDKTQTTTRCLKCREKDAKRHQRPEEKEKAKIRNTENNYSQASRERRRAKDEAAYLARNAEVQRNWRNANKEHVVEWRKTNVGYVIGSTLREGAKKDIDVEERDIDALKEMAKQPCHYCGFDKTSERLNGINRKDSIGGYTAENCVPCCKTCAFMKNTMDEKTFIEKCICIVYRKYPNNEVYQKAYRDNMGQSRSSKAIVYNKYVDRAKEKNLVFEISKAVFKNMIMEKCHYCHREASGNHINGIDRMDNERGYTFDNIVTCCSDCNYAKCDMDYDAFLEQCKRIADYELSNEKE